jgi:hypothetical protein
MELKLNRTNIYLNRVEEMSIVSEIVPKTPNRTILKLKNEAGVGGGKTPSSTKKVFNQIF